jgi:hypothetical protein
MLTLSVETARYESTMKDSQQMLSDPKSFLKDEDDVIKISEWEVPVLINVIEDRVYIYLLYE